jgi:hypothetical protein
VAGALQQFMFLLYNGFFTARLLVLVVDEQDFQSVLFPLVQGHIEH